MIPLSREGGAGHTETKRSPGKERQPSDALQAEGPRPAGTFCEPDRDCSVFSPNPLGNQPARAVTLDFQPPELTERLFLLFEATHFVVICYGGPRKLRLEGERQSLKGSSGHSL